MIQIIPFDIPVRSSAYFTAPVSAIALGTQGDDDDVSLTLGHEIAHALLHNTPHNSSLRDEIEAWDWVQSRIADWTLRMQMFMEEQLYSYGVGS